MSIDGNKASTAADTSPDGLKDDGLVVYENSLSLITHLYWFSLIVIEDENCIDEEFI